jgi:hypothetical protein
LFDQVPSDRSSVRMFVTGWIVTTLARTSFTFLLYLVYMILAVLELLRVVTPIPEIGAATVSFTNKIHSSRTFDLSACRG